MTHRWKFAVAAGLLLTGAAAAQEDTKNCENDAVQDAVDLIKPVQAAPEEDIADASPSIDVAAETTEDVSEIADVTEETAEETAGTETGLADMAEAFEDDVVEVSEAVEPEIEIPEEVEEANALSVLDYEAEQTGGVVDPEAAARAMTDISEAAPESAAEIETDAELAEADSASEESSETVALEEMGAAEEAEEALAEMSDEMIEATSEPGETAEAALDRASDMANDGAEDIAEPMDETLEHLEVVADEVSDTDLVVEAADAPVPASEAVSEVLEEAGLELADE